MKLRNKKIDKICEVITDSIPLKVLVDDNEITGCYSSLAELNEEWEDYEEPKEHYFITEFGGVYSLNEYEGLNNVANPEDYKAIGNYFDTKEEAEAVVKLLKSWKRLKDIGVKLKFHNDIGDRKITIHREGGDLLEGNEYYKYIEDLMYVIGRLCEID